MQTKLSLVISAFIFACICVSAAPDAKAAQETNPLFTQAQQMAAQVAASSQPDDIKASFAQRFSALASTQQQLWQLAGEVDSGQCVDGCVDNYNSQVEAWQGQLQQFSADASALEPQGDAQATMENHTSGPLDFYIDDQYQCHTLMNLMCTAQTKSGMHVFAGKSGDTVVKTENVSLTAGESRTWTVP